MRRLAILVSGSLCFWLLAALPARHVWGDSALVFSGVSVLLCLVPTALTLSWANWAMEQAPQQQLLVVLGGTGLRMFFVLFGGVLIYFLVPYFQNQQSFWIWVLISYLVTLTLEMALVLAARRDASGKTVASRS